MSAGKVPAVYVTVEDVTYPPGKPLPKGVAEKITNPKVWEAVEGAEQEEPGEGSGGYDSLTIPELEAEIDRRNEGRDEADLIQVGGKGNKPDLVEALEADDA